MSNLLRTAIIQFNSNTKHRVLVPSLDSTISTTTTPLLHPYFLLGRNASTQIPTIDPSTIHSSRFDNDPSKPQYYGVIKQSSIDPQIGDYPKLKWEGAQQRDPYGQYWDPADKRNFGEPLHHEDELLSSLAPDVHKYPTGRAFLELSSFFVFMYGIWLSADYYTTHYRPNPAAPREYSYPDFDGNKELEQLTE